MSIELATCTTVEEPLPKRVIDYTLTNKQAGRGGTWLKLTLRVTQMLRFKKVTVEFTDLVVEHDGDDVEVALDKLADWLERAAIELRARGKPAAAVASYPQGNP